MKKLLLILALLLASPCFGQVSSVVQSVTGGATTCAYTNNVVSGNTLYVFAGWLTSTNTPTISDTLTSTWNQILFDTSKTSKIAIYEATAASSGADTVSFTVSGSSTLRSACAEFTPGVISTTKDVSTVDAFTTTSNPTSSSITTTLDGDLLLSMCYTSSNSGVNTIADFFLTYGGGSPGMSAGFRYSAAHGSYSTNFGSNNSISGTIVLLAMKPSAITIVSPATLPKASTTDAYSYTLVEQGATAATTWSITAGALPIGLSINSSTGAITGTPTNSSNGFTVQVTDGTHTTTKAFTLAVGTALATISHVKDSAGGGTGVFTGSVTYGNLITATKIQATLNAAGIAECTDSLGTVFSLYAVIQSQTGGSSVNVLEIFAGLAPSTGADTVTCVGGTANTTFASEFSNTQNFNDVTSYIVNQATNTSLTTASATTLATNSLLYAGWIYSGNGTTITTTAPCNSIFSHASSMANGCYQIGTTIGGYTENITTSTNSGIWSALLGAFRPTTTGSAPLPSSGSTSSSQVY